MGMLAKEKLVETVGAGNVVFEPAILDEYSRDISFVNTTRPACIVKPRNADEVKEIVKLANDTQTPLVTISSGPPHFRGDTVPGAGGAAILDLRGLKKIIRVDRYHRNAMVEAGVTFEELIPAAQKEGIRLNIPLLPKKSKSVVASMLEREPVVMPKYQWDISDPVACLGLVMGNGEEFRTGQAAGPGTIEEQWAAGAVQKAPYGPGIIGWHRFFIGAQGTMGIITWASLRCELLPKLEEPFMVGSATLAPLLDMTERLMRRRLPNECFILNRTNLAAIMAKNWPGDYQALKYSLPNWILFYNLAGYDYSPQDRIKYQTKDILGITRQLGLESVRAMGRISANDLLKLAQQPSAEPYWKLRFKGACQDVFFLTINDKLQGFIDTMNGLADKAGYPVADMGIYLQPVVQGTSCHCEFNFFYNPDNQPESGLVKELSRTAVKTLMSNGAFFSRPYGENARMVMNKDAAGVMALTKIKKILDPNNILNPGKLCF
jgi:FAD/FMN-containing dehydrogenase